MICPVCGEQTKVLRTRKHNSVVFRIRKCAATSCFYRYPTKEEQDHDSPSGYKKAGQSS
jgi:transcriptional regulator NrdR family protein